MDFNFRSRSISVKYFLFRIRAFLLFPDFKIKETKLKLKAEKNSVDVFRYSPFSYK